MGKLLILASCCFIIAVSDSDTNDFLAFHGEPEPGHEEAVKDKYMQELFGQLLGKRSLHVGRGIGPFPLNSGPSPIGVNGMPEVMMLHNQLQNKLGWGSDDGGMKNSNKNQQYGPPPGPPPNQQYGPPPGPPPNQQYGPPPNQQFGPPPGPPSNQQYGPPPGPPPNQQYGPPPNQQYGPPPNQQYGPPPGPPPNQQYGPPSGPPPNQQYGPPSGPPPNQQYGPPPSQQYGPPPPPQNQQYGPPKQQYEPPPPPPNQQYGPPQQSQPSQEYGPPKQSQPSQEYGPPQQSQPSQEYGPPQQSQPSQEYGPPNNDNKLRVNQGTFGGHIENFKLADVVRNNKDNSARPPSKSAPSSQYGPPSFTDDSSGYSNNGLDDGGSDNAKIYKHVYIHTPPQEQEERLEPRVIRPGKKQDTHYQIIFVKAPAPPKQPPTEIELPAPPERKTLVYVLVKKPEKPAEIKFRAPPPTQPAKPEVYFIRYKGNKGKNGDRAEDLLSQIGGAKDVITTNSRPLRLNNVDDDDGGYDSKRGGDIDDRIIPNLLSSARTKDRDSVGYPNAEYRAAPIMLNPNDEPMSFAVYDRVRNEKVPTSPIVGGLATSASDLIISSRRSSRRMQPKKGGSHYTAPGSLPFDRPSGRMVGGHYVGMTSTALRNKYYAPQEEVK